MAKVAFLGLGIMGYPMAGHLKSKGGHEVTVYNRTGAKAEKWLSQHGGRAAPTRRVVQGRTLAGGKVAPLAFASRLFKTEPRGVRLAADGDEHLVALEEYVLALVGGVDDDLAALRRGPRDAGVQGEHQPLLRQRAVCRRRAVARRGVARAGSAARLRHAGARTLRRNAAAVALVRR